MSQTHPAFYGQWRIAEMEAWDKEYLDEEVKAFIRFDKKHMGEFQFGLVQGLIDYRETTRNGNPAVEFSWDGRDEMDSVSGRGWAVLEKKNVLSGMIFIHGSEESAFTAIRRRR